MKNFWTKLPKPFFCLAPMANVTDSAFRKMIAKYGKPDVMWTEFVSADGLISPGRKNLMHDLKFSKKEKPIVAQLFSGNPESMEKAAGIVAKLGFDGLDINMGCPDRAVIRQGGGAALMRDPKKAMEILHAARRGQTSEDRPRNTARRGTANSMQNIALNSCVSVKTRLGYSKIDLNWIEILLNEHLPALTIHLRTCKEMSDFPAHWEIMRDIIKLRNKISPETLIIGNGDVASLEDGLAKAKKSGCDGIMIGRGIFGKPWFFNKKAAEKTPRERLKIMVEHSKLFEKTFKGIKSFDVMKKHFKAYVSGWDGAKELRIKLMEAKNAKEVQEITSELRIKN